MGSKVEVASADGVMTVTITRPAVRNAVDAETAAALADAFRPFETDDSLAAAVLTGSGGHFCAGFDLKAFAGDSPNRLSETGDGPMGPTRMALNKPVIATLGVFNRRFGVPLIDLGTVRLPRMIGQGRALDLILSGRAVPALEALQIGLVERLVEPGRALEEAQNLAGRLSELPQGALRADRLSVLNQWSMSLEDAAKAEHQGGMEVLASGEAQQGAQRFAKGSGRHGM